MAGRFLPQRDRNFLERINKELVGDLKSSNDGIINQKIVIYKISTYDTSTNMYGEAVGGKNFKQGVQFFRIVDHKILITIQMNFARKGSTRSTIPHT